MLLWAADALTAGLSLFCLRAFEEMSVIPCRHNPSYVMLSTPVLQNERSASAFFWTNHPLRLREPGWCLDEHHVSVLKY